MNKYLLLSIVLLVYISCEKDLLNEDSVLQSAGSVTFEVLLTNNMPADSAEVFVHLPDSENEVIFHSYTDENGMVAVKKILEGNYGYRVEYNDTSGLLTKNGYFQIATGDNMLFEVNLAD